MRFSREQKRGSALLIVLGFLSFMVVSAVAFSVFMRSERVPSSALRSGVATRHLVKAALARAISRVDMAIGSDPFPGVRREDSIYAVSSYGAGNLFYDTWVGRVFMPPNPVADEAKTADGASQNMDAQTHAYYALPEETTPVLNLEALGYVPPALINDVRFQSRRSWAAKWEPLDYDAGRYAFCAVNVSDFIDINRVNANTNRSSASRVSLAHLFDNPRTFDSFVHYDPTHPFVSMMDYNLYFNTGTRDALTSPFCKWIKNGSYDMADTASTDTKGARNQFFVTDSWFPRETTSTSADNEKVLYLDDFNENSKHCGQPFKQSVLKNCANASIMQVVNAGATPFFNNIMKNKLCQTDWLSLFDYLDRDDLPLSVALPCCERVPMVAGVSLESANVHLKLVSNGQESSGGTSVGSTKTTITHYMFDSASLFQGGVAVLVAFPFKRLQELDQTFKVQAMARVFLAEKGFSTLRAAGALQGLRPKEDEWTGPTQFQLKRSGQGGIVLTAVSNNQNISLPNNVEEGADKVTVSVPLNLSLPSMSDANVFSKKEEQKYKSDGAGGSMADGSPTTSFMYDLKPFAADGALFGPDGWIDSTAFDALKATVFVPHVAIWVKITNSNGDLVDLCPALMDDDQEYGGQNNSGVATMWEANSSASPILRCAGEGDFQYATDPSTVDKTFSTFKPQAYLAVDPRFNWMPEDFVAVDGQGATPQNWWKHVKGILGVDGRDPDPFMFVSNQGYLQSMGELAFIPRGSDAFNGGDQIVGNSKGGANGNMRTAVAELANFGSMWRTYRAYQTSGLASDNLFCRGFSESEWKIRDASGGYRINPYSDNASIRLLPFTNTPYDWWVAGTNITSVSGVNPKDVATKQKILKSADASSGALAFAFNSESKASANASQLKDEQKKERKGEMPTANNDDRVKIANAIFNALRGDSAKSWEEIYDGLAWDSDDVDPENANSFRKFLGTELSGSSDPFHSVDRKFLYAYWRGCFANRQQLFLIFVRAESTALGGGEGRSPSQLGGRAVALVWRDPAVPEGTSEFIQNNNWAGANRKPHRTRILFYHQLD